MTSPIAAPPSPLEPRAARARALTFLALTFAMSLPIQARIHLLGGPIEDHPLEIVLLMWSPALASLVCRLVFREGVRDVSFRIGRTGARPWLVAWLAPLAVGLAAYGLAWATGLERFETPAESGIGLAGVAPLPRFALTIVFTLLVGPWLAGVTATGEELGWRGYLLTRLVDARVPRPALVSGAIWGLWHVPLIVTGHYAAGPYPIASACLFLVGVVAGGYIVALARLESGSVWAAALFHASWNATIQGPFDHFTAGGGASTTSSIWIGESGVLVVLAHVLVAGWLVRRGMIVRRDPLERGVRVPLAAL